MQALRAAGVRPRIPPVASGLTSNEHGRGCHLEARSRPAVSPSGETETRSRPAADPRADLRPFFSFYGGKWRDTPKYYPAPEYDTIVEPFAGSAGYSVRNSDKRIVLGEEDPVIFGVWNYLIHVSAADIRAIPDLEKDQSVDDLPVSQEARWLVGFWLNRAPARPRKRPSAWMRQGIRPGSFWGPHARNIIASQVDRIRHWQIFNCSYQDLPWRGDATWFIDPPYQNQGKHYYHSADSIDFAELGSWSRSRPGQVIVCEQEGADWLPFEPLARTKTARTGKLSHEVIWLNSTSPREHSEKQSRP
jgi:hypothetical protein